MKEKKTITVKQAADLLGIKKHGVRYWIKKLNIPIAQYIFYGDEKKFVLIDSTSVEEIRKARSNSNMIQRRQAKYN